MPLVVANTSPIFYLLSIGQIHLLAALFGKVFLPEAVYRELCHPAAPLEIRQWTAHCPAWIEVMRVDAIDDAAFRSLGAGEREAIALAVSMQAELILIDERKATAVALSKGFEVTGTLGILRLAADRRLIDLADSFAQLKRTNFRYRQEIMDALLNSGAPLN